MARKTLMKLRHYMTALAALLLASCQTSCQTSGSLGAGEAEYLSSDTPEEGKLFGDYLAGSYAYYIEKTDARSDYYNRAYARADDDIALGRRAMSSALTAGNIDLTQKIALDIHGKDNKEAMALAILGTKAFEQGRNKKAQDLFNTETKDLTMGILMGIVKGWSQVSSGDIDQARTTFKDIGGGSYCFSRFANC